ncbi:hypothetical protein C1H46_036135 [Malus baccata]|uniref:Uncharacterized protein n=1 Tax=Malus baccata TaxID=106549 RepID=A0A540KVV5_MALBA|nr:hypothetical protein C1H46_036135 [Malus baccata]
MEGSESLSLSTMSANRPSQTPITFSRRVSLLVYPADLIALGGFSSYGYSDRIRVGAGTGRGVVVEEGPTITP